MIRDGGLVKALIKLLAALVLVAAPVRFWVDHWQLPHGFEVSRAQGTVLRGELILAVAAVGAGNPVFVDWGACDDGGWDRCWQAHARDLQGRGRISVSPGGTLDLRDSTLDGRMAVSGLFVAPVIGRWQVSLQQLRFDLGACLPGEIELLEAEVELQDGRVLGLQLAPHHASLRRQPGQPLTATVAGDSMSGTVSMGFDGHYSTDLQLRLPVQLLALVGEVTGAGGYRLQQTGVMPCM